MIISENKLLYWFHFLQSQVGEKSPVILIATKLDLYYKREKEKKNKVDLQERITQIDKSKNNF
jgi:hypothetical protein